LFQTLDCTVYIYTQSYQSVLQPQPAMPCYIHNYIKCQKHLGGATGREFELEVPAAEEMSNHDICSREQFSDVP